MPPRKRTTNGIATDIEWIKKTLEDYSNKFDKIEEKLESLVTFKAQVRSEARAQARMVSLLIALIPSVLSILSFLYMLFSKN